MDRHAHSGSCHPRPEEHQHEGEHRRRHEQPGCGPRRPGQVHPRQQGEPGHERRVLDGVPGPVATPPELDVGPVGSEHQPDPDEKGRHANRSSKAGDIDDVVTTHHSIDTEQEWDRRQQQARIENRRMDEHGRMIEDRSESPPTDRRDGEPLEGIGRKGGDQGGAEHQRASRDVGQPRHRVAGEARHDDDRKDRRPQQQRTLHAAPQTGQPIGRGARGATVVDDVGEREVGLDQRPAESEDGNPEGAGASGEAGEGRSSPSPPCQGCRRDRERCGDPDRERSDVDHQYCTIGA